MNQEDKLEFVKLVDEVVSKRFAESEAKLNQTLDQRFAESEAKLNQTLDQRFAESNQTLDQRFAESNQTLDQRFKDSEQRIVEDMKQFTSSLVSQQTSAIRDDISRLEQKVDDISLGIAEALDTSNTVIDDQLSDHELRILKLEGKAA